jgi:outer membrane protein OmpA-like peptidoglycan-associated protein
MGHRFALTAVAPLLLAFVALGLLVSPSTARADDCPADHNLEIHADRSDGVLPQNNNPASGQPITFGYSYCRGTDVYRSRVIWDRIDQGDPPEHQHGQLSQEYPGASLGFSGDGIVFMPQAPGTYQVQVLLYSETDPTPITGRLLLVRFSCGASGCPNGSTGPTGPTNPGDPGECKVSNVSLLTGQPGDRVTVAGTGFGSGGQVTFGDALAPIESWTGSRIVAFVPEGATSGAIVVRCGSTTNTNPLPVFTVADPNNLPPVANPVIRRLRHQPTKVALDGSLSSDPDGKVVAYRWTEKGRSLGRARTLTRRFSAGRHTVTLTVTDNDGATSSKSVRFTVTRSRKPTPTTSTVRTPSDVLFAFGSCTLSARGRTYLRQLRPLVRSADWLRISGHTDWVGSNAYNQKLSVCRAKAVKNVLLSGLRPAPKKVTVRGYGERHPVASNATAAGRAKNRRVEIVFRTS